MLAACGRSPDKSSRPIAATTVVRPAPPASAVRLARSGGKARAYALPTLEPLDWQSDASVGAVDTLIGSDFEQHSIFAIDHRNNLVGVDLDTRRVRTYQPHVTLASIGPDGSLFAVDTGHGLTQLGRRSITHLAGTVTGHPSGMFANASGDVLVAEPRAGSLALHTSDTVRPIHVPAGGPVTATFWGDLAAVGSDTGIILLDPEGKRSPATVRDVRSPRALLFSPSGHRLYVAAKAAQLLVVDRFGRSVLRTITLPAPAADLRTDFFGNWLVARPVTGDSVWIVDLDAERVAGSIASGWAADLPALAAPHALLLRQGDDIVARDLSHTGFPETGRVKDGAKDFWAAAVWAPAQESPVREATADTARVVSTAPAAGADSAGAATAADTTGPALYLQVSSSRNPSWADDLAGKLRAAGLHPTVLKPAASEESYRVVLGPFRTRDEAEATGRRLGMPSFVITAQGDSGR